MNYAFPPAPVVTLEAMSSNPFPVRRIFCVGQNYADHVREMGSAPDTAITPEFYSGTIARGKIELKVNGQIRQSADVGDMLWKIPQIVHFLSNQVELFPGDLIFTGTPAGVGPVVKGDVIEAAVAGLEPLIITIG